MSLLYSSIESNNFLLEHSDRLLIYMYKRM